MKKIALLALIVLNSCNIKKESKVNTDDKPVEVNATVTTTSNDLENTKWKLISMNDKKVSADSNVTLNFTGFENNEQRINGNSFVNGYNGIVTVSNNNIKFGDGMVTQKASTDQNLNQLESQYLANIQDEVTYTKIDNSLTFTKAGKVVLVFEAVK